CYLCPNKYSFDEETYEGGEFELIAKDDGVRYAHGLCAMFVPETEIASSDGSDNDCKIIEKEPIPKFRFETECQICHTKLGACVKCQEEGCTKYFHVSCGDLHGNQLKGIDIAGKIYYVIHCKIHEKTRRIEEDCFRRLIQVTTFDWFGEVDRIFDASALLMQHLK
ncbi:16546_t:CDS:2, partial [Acaulospora morrowiae]